MAISKKKIPHIVATLGLFFLPIKAFLSSTSELRQIWLQVKEETRKV